MRRAVVELPLLGRAPETVSVRESGVVLWPFASSANTDGVAAVGGVLAIDAIGGELHDERALRVTVGSGAFEFEVAEERVACALRASREGLGQLL